MATHCFVLTVRSPQPPICKRRHPAANCQWTYRATVTPACHPNLSPTPPHVAPSHPVPTGT